MALPRAAALAALSVALLLLPATFWPVAAVVRSGRTAVPAGWGDAFGSTTGPAFVVAKDGSGNFTTVQAAVDAVPKKSTKRVVILIKPGTYREKVTIAKGKSFITLQGQDALTTKIVWNDWAGRKVDGEELSTIGSCTLCVSGYNLIVNHLTIENDHPKPSAGSTTDQAVALRITGDMAAFYNSRFIGWQDTLYDHKNRHFFKACYIEGSWDFVFGYGQSIYEGCTLFAKDWGSYTAQKRMSTSEASGFVFLRSNITGSGKALLGRAWGPAARTIYAFSFLDKGVDPSGWGVIKDFDSDKSIFFALHKCWGPGYSAAARSTYSRTLSSRQAAQFTYYSFIGASDWLGPDPPGPMWSYSFPTTSTYRPSRFNIPEAP